jgi:glycosyltransferase involved in cell wall biosynthesis
MNPAGVRPGVRDIVEVVGIDELYAGRVDPSGDNWRYLLNLPRVMRAVRGMKPDAIVAIYLSSYGLLAALAKADSVLAQVMIGSDIMLAPGRSKLHQLLTRFALARGDLFVSASAAMTARIAALGNLPSAAILTQQYGLEDWVLNYPFLPKTFDFVSNRAWVGNSNLPYLLRTFRQVHSSGTLALIGSGPVDAEIRQLAADDPRVTPLGVVTYEKNIEVVARSKFYMSMTASDGASLSLMEAMAVGAIPVVSDIQANREWVEDGVNGALVPLDDEGSASARIREFVAQPDEKLDIMRVSNREIVRERGNLARNMARFRQRLTATLEQRRRKNR